MKLEVSSAALLGAAAVLGVGYLFGQLHERKRHEAAELKQLLDDGVPDAAPSSPAGSEGALPCADELDSPILAPSPTKAVAVTGMPPRPVRPSLPSDTVGRAHSGVVVHIDEGRRKQSLDRSAAGGPVVVGVAGGSGSGKTSIASLIAARLEGRSVVSISSDNYYITIPPGTDVEAYNFDHPAAIDFPLLASHLACLKRGETVEVPTYDFVSHRRTGRTLRVCGRATDVIIVDGIFVLWSERVRGLCDVTLFTVEDSDVCLARRLRRDLVERGRTVESVLTQYLRHVKTGFQQFVAPSMGAADFIIPRARENATAIDMLARDITRRVADNRGGTEG